MTLSILALGYNRADALERLLSDLERASYPDQIDLEISIDGGGSPEVASLAHHFHWPHGEKRCTLRDTNLGLRQHVILAVTEALSRSAALAVFEDDIRVSPHWHSYAAASLPMLHTSPRVCGASLYSPQFNEIRGVRFGPVWGLYDNYFIQLPSSWGQIFTRRAWQEFLSWSPSSPSDNALPRAVQRWGIHSWKRHFLHYMIERDVFFSYPYWSYTSNSGLAGQNIHRQNDLLSVPLCMAARPVHVGDLDDDSIIYDAWGLLRSHRACVAAPAETSNRFAYRRFTSEDELISCYPVKHVSIAFAVSAFVVRRRLGEFTSRIARKLSSITRTSTGA